MGMIERIAEAQISSDLSDKLALSDVDLIRCSGWAAQHHPIGLMLYRLKFANDHNEWDGCIRRAYSLVIGRAYKRRMKITSDEMKHIADTSLRYFLHNVCPSCLGRGAHKVKDAPKLEDAACNKCNGTGVIKLSMPVADHRDLAFWLFDKMQREVEEFLYSAHKYCNN